MSAPVATTDRFTVNFKVQGQHVIVWASVGRTTRLFDNIGSVACADGDTILISAMRWECTDAKTPVRLRPLQSFMLRASRGSSSVVCIKKPCATLQYTADCTLTDCADAWQTHQMAHARACERGLHDFVTRHNIRLKGDTHCYIAPAMMQCDYTDGKSLALCGGLGGWPQLTRMSFTPQIYWVRAVAYALALTEASADDLLDPSQNRDAYRVLCVSALTAFAGNYPRRAESMDDRSLGCMKLDTNRDCDDMAMTVASCERELRRMGPLSYPPAANIDKCAPAVCKLAELLHAFLCSYYSGSAVVVCKALPKAANPRLHNLKGMQPIGHVFAILTTMPWTADGECSNMFVGADVVESTRQSHPFEQPLSTVSAHFKRPDWTFGPPGIGCLKPLVHAQYPVVVCAHTHNSTSLAVHPRTNTFGCSLQELLEGRGSMKRMQLSRDKAQMAVDNIAHFANLDAIDAACEKYKWADVLGIKHAGPLTHTTDLTPWNFTGSPTECNKPGYGLTQSCAYAFWH